MESPARRITPAWPLLAGFLACVVSGARGRPARAQTPAPGQAQPEGSRPAARPGRVRNRRASRPGRRGRPPQLRRRRRSGPRIPGASQRGLQGRDPQDGGTAAAATGSTGQGQGPDDLRPVGAIVPWPMPPALIIRQTPEVHERGRQPPRCPAASQLGHLTRDGAARNGREPSSGGVQYGSGSRGERGSGLRGGAGHRRGDRAGLDAESARVAAVDRDPMVLELAGPLSPTGLGLVADVTDYEAVRRTAEEVAARFGRCDHLVFAVGAGSGKFGFPFWKLEPADWDRVLRVNLIGAVNVAHAFAPAMAEAAMMDPDLRPLDALALVGRRPDRVADRPALQRGEGRGDQLRPMRRQGPGAVRRTGQRPVPRHGQDPAEPRGLRGLGPRAA